MTISSYYAVRIIRSATILLLLLGCSGSARDDRKQQINAGASADSATITATQRADHQPASIVSRLDSGTDLSAIWVVSDPACALILTDPDDRRTSSDPRAEQSLQEIPNSSGSNEYIEDPTEGGGSWGTNQLEINRPTNGDYRLTVIGTQNGAHNISVRAYNSAGESSTWSQSGITIAENVAHAYNLHFDKTSPTPGVISGGFDGEALPGELNMLLSYGTVTGTVTTLPAGTVSFALLTFYAPTLVPGTFSATLNDTEISNLFTPVAGRHELVIIPLRANKNVLRLRAAGTTGTDRGMDEDVLEFVVD